MNWIKKQTSPEVSTVDKARLLLRNAHRLILVHADELLRLKRKNNYKDVEIKYVSRLHTHYIVNGLGKNEFYNLKI